MNKIYQVETDLTPTLNVYLGMHFRERTKKKNYFTDLVKLQVKAPKVPLEKFVIVYVRYSTRMIDFDGLVGSAKILADAMIKCGIIIDDSLKNSGDWLCRWEKVKHLNEQKCEMTVIGV